jgi:hypothetical protein
VVVVFGLGPAGQTLGRVIRPVLKFLTDARVRNFMYVNDGWIVAAIKRKRIEIMRPRFSRLRRQDL